jgi:hypothetical protein
MMCRGCGQQMQRETVVRVVRLKPFGRPRATVRSGWHCWACNMDDCESAPPGPQASMPPHAIAAARTRLPHPCAGWASAHE